MGIARCRWSGPRCGGTEKCFTIRWVIRPISWRKLSFYPVWDYTKAGLVDILTRARIKVPRDYAVFGRSFDGLDYRFLAPMKKHFPADYRRVLEWFPLAELELFRFERVVR